MIDERLVRALAGIVRAGGTYQRACLIGGQALRDLSHALQARLGEIPTVRTSEDLDLLIAVGENAEADRALKAHLREQWDGDPNHGATYRWKIDADIQLDLATTYDAEQSPGKVARITLHGTGRILAYCMIPSWLHAMNLIEPCHGTALRNIGLERLRHTALLISKILAVDSCLGEMAIDQPATWVRRIDRDLADVLYLTDRSVRSGLWCAASTAKRPELRIKLQPIMQRITIALSNSQTSMADETRDHLRTVVDGFSFWRP
jgi:hypothetical protein